VRADRGGDFKIEAYLISPRKFHRSIGVQARPPFTKHSMTMVALILNMWSQMKRTKMRAFLRLNDTDDEVSLTEVILKNRPLGYDDAARGCGLQIWLT
jgi:hypothetical protein